MTTRRQFVAGAVTSGILLGSARWSLADDEKPAKIDSEMIGKFVGKSHGDLETVTSMLKDEPALVNAAWDWGGGDFETGLNAASHVGRRAIAELLLENGAILDAPAAVMLGHRALVAEMLKAYPKLHAVPGAHKIPLLSHAIFGGKESAEVFDLLIEAGADVNAKSQIGMTPLMAAASIGNVEQLNKLIRCGADHHAKDSKNQTAMDIAEKREHKGCVQALKNAMGMF